MGGPHAIPEVLKGPRKSFYHIVSMLLLLSWKRVDISSTLVNFRGRHIVLYHFLLHVICHIDPRLAHPAVEARPEVPKSRNGDACPSYYTISFTCNVLILVLVPSLEEAVFVPVM
jgi:hypothetical protein